jgi:hypothetical protein
LKPRTVLIAAGDSLRLHWQSHPLDSYAIWTALPNDTVFVPYASAIADTHLTIAISLRSRAHLRREADRRTGAERCGVFSEYTVSFKIIFRTTML